MIETPEIQKALSIYAEKTKHVNVHKRLAFYDGVIWAIETINEEKNNKKDCCETYHEFSFKFCPDCGNKMK